MSYRVLLWTFVAAGVGAAAGCQLHPRPVDAVIDSPAAPVPVAPLPYHVSGMHIETVRSMTYFYTSTQTTLDDMAEPAARTVGELKRLTKSGQVLSMGPILFVYHDQTEDRAAPFDLEMGIGVLDKVMAKGEFKIRTLPAFRCATLVYRGPLTQLGRAYDKLIPQMIAAGHIPSDETRESYIVWEGADSPNNVVEIEVGIQ